MDYSNPKIPEGINTGKEHPLKEFAILTSGVLGVVIVAVLILSLAAEKLAAYIPFKMEQRLVEPHQDLFPEESEVSRYLQNLADELGEAMNLPDGMRITVHYSDKDTVNAYATLGGNIVIFRGLLQRLPHENALAMVLAHEMAHAYHRHPIIATGRGLAVGMALASFAGLSGNNVFSGLISDVSLLTVMTFSRAQERQADQTGVSAVARYYGHVSGSADLFLEFVKLQDEQLVSLPAFMSSHPLSQDRIEDLHRYSEENGWAMDQPTRPLDSSALRRALETD